MMGFSSISRKNLIKECMELFMSYNMKINILLLKKSLIKIMKKTGKKY